jgi:hypothetical protein
MAERYAIGCVSTALTTTEKVMGEVYHTAAAPTSRISVYDLVIGADVTAPADNAISWTVKRASAAAPTGGSAPTVVALDPASPTAIAVGYQSAATVVPTLSAALLLIPLNQRASFRWVAVPGGELKAAATQYAGIAACALHASATPQLDVSMHWEE